MRERAALSLWQSRAATAARCAAAQGTRCARVTRRSDSGSDSAAYSYSAAVSVSVSGSDSAAYSYSAAVSVSVSVSEVGAG